MKKIVTNPVTYVAIAVVAIIVYLAVKDGGLKSSPAATTPAVGGASTATV